MRRFSLACLLAIAASTAFVFGAAGAQAATVKEVFEQYGQIGTFAWDCSKPVSKDNRYYVNRLIDDNHLQRDEMIGPTTREHMAIIDRASALGPNQMALSGKRDNLDTEAVWGVEPTRQIALEVLYDGKKVVSGGKFVGNGQQLPWTNKCGGPGQQPE